MIYIHFYRGYWLAFAISFLRETRKHDDSYIILFYLMAFGTIINTILVLPFFIVPRGTAALYLVFGTAVSFIGQVSITVGYKYISAAPGAIVSSSRIIIAAVLGISFFNDPITIKVITGSILIFLSLMGISGMIRFNSKK